MFPHKTRTEIIGDLLTSALEKIEHSFPSVKGEYEGYDDFDENKLYRDLGKGQTFMALANKHSEDLEKELGNETPSKLYDYILMCTEADI